MHFKYVIYKITFPNGKIYIGKDIGGKGHSLRYFGSWDNAVVAKDFTKEEFTKFSLTKEILFESSDKNEVSKMEADFIRQHRATDPQIGYNQWPRTKNV